MRLPTGPKSLPHHNILQHLFIISLLLIKLSCLTSSQPMNFKVGFIFDPKSPPGIIANTTVPMALDDFYTAYPWFNRISLITRTSPGGDIVNSASAALELITQEKVHAILSPGLSPELAFVAEMGTKAKVPIISCSSTSPSVSHSHSSFFIRAAANDITQAGAIAALAKAFGWRRMVPIYQDDDYGSSLIPYLVDALDGVDARIPYRQAVSASASDDEIQTILATLQNEQTRVFVVHMRVSLGTRIFNLANTMGMMSEGYVWILTDGLTSLLSWLPEESMEGVLGLTTYYDPMLEKLRNFKKRWTAQFMKDNPKEDLAVAQDFNRYAIWAYDAAWAVAIASTQIAQTDNQFVNTVNGSTELSSMGASTTGENLLQAILDVKFDGIGGPFKLVNGKLNLSVFHIVNVNGGKGRTIGYYTPTHGLSKKLEPQSNASYSTSRDGLKPVIWPGDSTVQPKGWVQPTNGRKLRIAVPGPVLEGFKVFLDMQKDNATNQITATGFVIDMFEAAVEKLPYALPLEYVQVLDVKYDDLVKMIGNGVSKPFLNIYFYLLTYNFNLL